MIFNKHSELEGSHAFLGASKFQWISYDDDTLAARYVNSYSQAIGTALHELARRLISYRMKLAKTDKKLVQLHLLSSGIPEFAIDIDKVFSNFMTYVNDAIGFEMSPEVILFYSYNCYGCADSICYRNNVLRIHDYKSGDSQIIVHYLKLSEGEWYDAELVQFGPSGTTWVEVAAFRTWDYRIGVQAKAADGKVYELFTQFMGIGKQTAEHLDMII